EPQTAAHAEEMFALLSDPAIYEYENGPPPSLEWLRERFARLESRSSADGSEQWLNWVIRLPTSGLVGYVQAIVKANGQAAIAYELSSAYWGRGLARLAVQAMMTELADHYRAHTLSPCMYAAIAEVEVVALEQDRRIAIRWPTPVEWLIAPRGE